MQVLEDLPNGKPWKLHSPMMWLKKVPANSTWSRIRAYLDVCYIWIHMDTWMIPATCNFFYAYALAMESCHYMKSSFRVTCAMCLAAYKARFRAWNLRNFPWRPALLPDSWRPLLQRRYERLARTSLRSDFKVLRNHAFPSLRTMGAHGYLWVYMYDLWICEMIQVKNHQTSSSYWFSSLYQSWISTWKPPVFSHPPATKGAKTASHQPFCFTAVGCDWLFRPAESTDPQADPNWDWYSMFVGFIWFGKWHGWKIGYLYKYIYIYVTRKCILYAHFKSLQYTHQNIRHVTSCDYDTASHPSGWSHKDMHTSISLYINIIKHDNDKMDAIHYVQSCESIVSELAVPAIPNSPSGTTARPTPKASLMNRNCWGKGSTTSKSSTGRCLCCLRDRDCLKKKSLIQQLSMGVSLYARIVSIGARGQGHQMSALSNTQIEEPTNPKSTLTPSKDWICVHTLQARISFP